VSQTVRCPECDRPVPRGRPGRKLYCQKCDLEFRPPRRAEDAAADPPRRGRSNPLGTVLLIVVPFVVVGVGFLVARAAGAFRPTAGAAEVPAEEIQARRLAALEAISVETAYATERIELSEPRLETFLKESELGKFTPPGRTPKEPRLALFVRARVKYRFPSGKPHPAMAYHLTVRLNTGMLGTFNRPDRNELSPSGELVTEIEVHNIKIPQTLAEVRASGVKELPVESDKFPMTATFEARHGRKNMAGMPDGDPVLHTVTVNVPRKEAYPVP
jgi:hypothetical protein